jgi:hypothetical protein
MKISAPPSKGVPVAIPFPLTVTIPNSGPRLRLEVIEKGPMGEEIVKGSGQAKVIRDDGTSKVIEIIPAQLGRVTVQVLAGDPDSMTIVQNEIQVDVYPVAKGLKSFDLGVGRRLYLTLDGPRHGERWLKPSLIYLNLGVVNADDAGAIKLTVNQPEDEPVIRLDNSGLIHPLRPGKATIIGDIEGVQDRVEVIVYGTRDDIPKLNRQAR